MALGTAWGTSFFTGTTTTTETFWDVAIGGHGYAVDREQQWMRQTVEMIRQQSDTSDRPGEASLNPAGLWNRSQESWHHGAGQSWLDRQDTDPFRFHTSKGVNPWEPYGLTLLPDTTQSLSSSSPNLALTVFDGDPYLIDGHNVRTSNNLTTWTTLTGDAGVTARSICSDGSAVYVAYDAQGVYRTTDGLTLSSWATGSVNLIRYVKGRLIAAYGQAVYNIITAGALPTALLTHANTAWVWTDACEGQGQIFLSGYARDKSLIYRTAVTPDGTALGAPTVAGELPDGETALSLTGYLGFVVVGTNLGVRFAAADDTGNLTIGALIRTPSSVLCGEGQDRFVWFGYTNYDTTSTGLGRLDLKTFTSDLTPAYATDLMATGQGNITSVITVGDVKVFTVAGGGVYVQTGELELGTYTSGRVGFGIADSKTALSMDVRHEPLPMDASVAALLAVDGALPGPIGTSNVVGSTLAQPGVLAVSQLSGSFFEWTVNITGQVELRRVTLRADPNAERTELVVIPILLKESVELHGTPHPVDVYTEWAYLRSLCLSRRPVNYQEGRFVDRVVIEDFTWTPDDNTRDGTFNTGTFTIRAKSV